MNDPQPEGHMASHIGRRKFLATLGGAAAAWPLAGRLGEAYASVHGPHPHIEPLELPSFRGLEDEVDFNSAQRLRELIESVHQISCWVEDYDENLVPEVGWSKLEKRFGRAHSPELWLIGKQLPKLFDKYFGRALDPRRALPALRHRVGPQRDQQAGEGLREENGSSMMQPHLLFALLLITESTPVQKREVTWTAEFRHKRLVKQQAQPWEESSILRLR